MVRTRVLLLLMSGEIFREFAAFDARMLNDKCLMRSVFAGGKIFSGENLKRVRINFANEMGNNEH